MLATTSSRGCKDGVKSTVNMAKQRFTPFVSDFTTLKCPKVILKKLIMNNKYYGPLGPTPAQSWALDLATLSVDISIIRNCIGRSTVSVISIDDIHADSAMHIRPCAIRGQQGQRCTVRCHMDQLSRASARKTSTSIHTVSKA